MQNANNNANNDEFQSNTDEERSIPLSFEDSSESLSVAQTAARRRFGFGSLVLASVAVVAVVSLFSMRTIGRSGAAVIEQSDAGKLVETFLKEQGTTKKADGLPADLLDSEAYAALRIERDELTKDPFVLAGETVVTVDPVSGGDTTPAVVGESPEARRAAQIEGWNAIIDAGTAEIRVQSVMFSARGASVASVNGKLLKVGDTLTTLKTEMEYRVDAIEQGTVRFRARHESLGVERTVTIPVATSMTTPMTAPRSSGN